MRPHLSPRRAAALAVLTALALAAPPVWAATIDTARAAVDRRDFSAALPAYEALLANDPANADLLIEAARVSGFADRNAEAAARYRRVLEVAPARRADVLPSLAWQTLWAGDAAAAVPLFEELAGAKAGRAEALDGLGQARYATGDTEGAIAAWRAALAEQPTQPGVERRLARALLWADRHDEAAAVLEAALARNPADRESAWLLASVHNYAGLHFRAVQEFTRLGAPHNAGESADLARAWAWAGFEDRAHALLAGTPDAEMAWWRDARIGRELRPRARAVLEHAVDSDSLETWNAIVSAGWQPAPGSTAELRLRRASLTDPRGAPEGTELQGTWRWRIGEPDAPMGVLWPSFGLRLTDWRGWSPWSGFARVAWLPADRWRISAEAARDLVETPQAIAERVSVDTVALGFDHRPHPRLGLALGLAALRFDDGNQRRRINGRAEWLAAGRPRWVVGVDAMAFDDSQPTGPGVPGRGYWNPERYREARVFTGLSTEQRPWDASLRVGLGRSIEVDGDGKQSRGEPDFWELTAGLDVGASARWRLAVGGSGGGFGVTSGGTGYWRRYATLSFNAWF